MKKIFTLIAVVASMLAFTTSAKADAYTIDDNAVEAAFQASVSAPISMDVINASIPTAVTKEAKVAGSSNAWVAFALAFIVGQLGIHRFYLGTATMTGIGYILTCGGIFGIVPFVDWIVLLVGAIQGDVSKYEDNTKFFMW
jgi:TM2 domain-containing membrane protein YozV